MKYMTFLSMLLLLTLSPLLADGLLLCEDEHYPGRLLRNRLTEVQVRIDGLVAETRVYQEFVNEWDRDVDATWSFPLPADARSTRLLYARNDSVFQAVLRVEPQSPNPGTGTGGVVARINQYLGRNALRLALKGIAPGAVQRVELHYISLLAHHQGVSTYRYPLDTGDFIRYPIEHLEVSVEVNSSLPITAFDLPSHANAQVLLNEPHRAMLRLRQPYAYLARDLEFTYQVDNFNLGIDFYSQNNDTLDGHFALFVRPENQADSTHILQKRLVFLLGNSSRVVGYKLEQSILAITDALDRLSVDDAFNIILYNNSVFRWQNQLLPGTAANIAAAKTFLASVTGQGGSCLDVGLTAALQQFQNDLYSNAIVAFTDGFSPLDPRQIGQDNIWQTGIFPIAIGDDVSRTRLEMTAAFNYGFVTYFDESADLRTGIGQVMEKINQPILKNTEIAFNKPDINRLLPVTLPTTYAGACFFITGRYRLPETAMLGIFGSGVNGGVQYDFQVTYEADTLGQPFSELIWAKETIDALEREIDVYGETEALKDSVIAISLLYNIRCRYTAYFADYQTVITGIDPPREALPVLPRSFVQGNYPNPFNPSTTIRLFIDSGAAAQVKFIKIYNLLGQLVAVIDVSKLGGGWHDIVFNGRHQWGNSLPSGIYFVRFEIGGRVINTIRVNLAR